MAVSTDGSVFDRSTSDGLRPRRAATSPFLWTHGLINRLVCLADVVTLLGVGAAQLWLGAAGPLPLTQGAILLVVQTVGFVFVLHAVGAYRVETYARLALSLASAALGLVCAWALGAAVVANLAAPAAIASHWSLDWHLSQLAALLLLRTGVRGAMAWVARLGLLCRNTLVIGSGAEAADVIGRLTVPEQSARHTVVAAVSDRDTAVPGLFAGRPLLGGLTAIADWAQRDAVDLVVIALPPARRSQLPRIIEALQWVSADVVLCVDPADAQAGGPTLAGLPVTSLMQRPLKGSQSLLKAAEDRVIAAVALVTISPVLLLIALAIRLDSPGPALFRQDRVGLHNRTFRIFKFRTMTVDPTDDGAKGTTSRHDKRITRVGGVLRSLSLDELPQLLNVLIGDMSIVGPRPYVRNMLVEGQTFDSAVQGFAARHRVRPGITGLAQASGFRSNALRNRRNAARSVQLDMDYMANWSLWLDLRIMVRTVTRGMSGPEVF
jgi:putative colanic acid biosynthesis UDP-glucose lipid carrier transferase